MKRTLSTYFDAQEMQLTETSFNNLRDKAIERRPQLEYILDKYGDMSLLDFAKQYNEPSAIAIDAERKTQFIEAFTLEVERLLGEDVAISCAKQLAVTYRVTTTDHHGPLSEPGMVNSNIHEALPYLNGDNLVKNVIVLGCANVSFDNESFPRGLLFHGVTDENLVSNQLVFFSRSVRPCPVIYYHSYTQENLDNAKKLITTWAREKTITPKEQQGLESLLVEIYADPSVLSCVTFSEQVTKTNYKLWRKLMEAYPDAPNLVYIEQESLVNTLLDRYHLNQDTFINRLLFTPKYHDLLVKHFDGILRGFSLKDKAGTYLFWALPNGQKYRVQLWKNGDYLQTEDGSYKIPLTPEGIHEAIVKKELIPSTLMSFMLLSFYYGVKLVGGTNQTTYLTQMKEAFLNMQREYGDKESVAFAQNLPTTDLSVAVQSLAFLQTPQDERVPVTGVDLLLHGDILSLPAMKQVAKNVTVREAFYRVLPDCYKWYYREDERDPELVKITKDDVEKFLGIEHKIIPAVKISR